MLVRWTKYICHLKHKLAYYIPVSRLHCVDIKTEFFKVLSSSFVGQIYYVRLLHIITFNSYPRMTKLFNKGAGQNFTIRKFFPPTLKSPLSFIKQFSFQTANSSATEMEGIVLHIFSCVLIFTCPFRNPWKQCHDCIWWKAIYRQGPLRKFLRQVEGRHWFMG